MAITSQERSNILELAQQVQDKTVEHYKAKEELTAAVQKFNDYLRAIMGNK